MPDSAVGWSDAATRAAYSDGAQANVADEVPSNEELAKAIVDILSEAGAKIGAEEQAQPASEPKLNDSA